MKRHGMTEAEAGRLGALATQRIWKERRENKKQEYEANPKLCPVCGKPIPFRIRQNKTCSRSCACTFGNKKHDKETYKRQALTLRKTLLAKGQNVYSNGEVIIQKPIKKINSARLNNTIIKIPNVYTTCKVCGAIKGQCKDPYICKHHQILKSLIRFGFDISTKGTEKVINEFYRVRDIIEHEYRDNRITEKELESKYGYTSGMANFHKILKSLRIKTLSPAEAVPMAYMLGRHTPNSSHTQYKEDDHISWEGKTFHLRSSYETDYANELDKNKIKYDYECLSIVYFDTQKQRYRTAIPDFYLIDTNTIVEIKSDYTLDKQNMIDKLKRYTELGYNFKLIVNHKEENIFEYQKKR